MITNLLLHNFKSHSNTELNLKPLTIISGLNNCGKSSILQSLLLLRQSYIKKRLQDGLDLNTPLISLGVGNDILYKMSKEALIEIKVVDQEEVFDFIFDAEEALDDTFVPFAKGGISYSDKQLSHLSLFNSHFQYLSAERWGGVSDYPSDSYSVAKEKQISKENGRGELIGNYLHTFKHIDTYDYTKMNGETLSLLDQVIIWESRISNGITIEVQALDDKSGYTISYGTKGEDSQISGLKASNIGYGVSYSLPIIVALLTADPGSLIIIENPEAHLHPEGISELTKLICLSAQKGVQVIVETHSDHVINGTLVNCKKYENGEIGIDRNNVSVYYISGKDKLHSSIVEKIDIQDGGHLEHQPKGFFDRIEKDRNYIWE